MTTQHLVSARARQLAASLAELFAKDSQLAQRLNDAQDHLAAANDRLWWGLAPDGQAAVYGEHPAAVDAAFANNRGRRSRRALPAAHRHAHQRRLVSQRRRDAHVHQLAAGTP